MEPKRTQQENPGLAGRYLYAVVPAGAVDSMSFETTGLNGQEIYPVIGDEVAAIVSDIEPVQLRPERKHLAAHHGVLRKLMDEAPILPVAFGIIAGDEQEVRSLLAEHQESFRSQLEELAGKVEMGVRCRLGGQQVFEYFIANYPELRQMRDDLYSKGEPSREAKIELGKLFQELLDRVRDDTAEKMQQGLSTAATRFRVNPPRNESELLNLAALVSRDAIDAFGKAVEEVGAKLDEQFEVEVNGPWPPHNFVDLRIHLETEEAQEAH